LILFDSKLWMRNFQFCTRQILRIWFPYLLVRVLVVVRVYKIKTNSDGSIERYKVRLVVKWYFQQYSMNYMVSNKYLVLGLRNFLLWFLPLNLFLVVMILFFLLSALMQVVSFYLYMLMTWLLLVIILMIFKFWRQLVR